MKSPKVLIACEESQTVCKAFRERGIEAYSCDIQEPSGGHPEWHILGDALTVIRGGGVLTMDGALHDIGKWDLIIAHPPCTHLAASGERWFSEKRKPLYLRFEAAAFFLKFAEANVPRIAVENPVGKMSTFYRKPDCIIQPWQFALSGAENTLKTTCLWLKGLPPLKPLITEKPKIEWHNCVGHDGKNRRQTQWYYDTRRKGAKYRATAASKTFPGIAAAMAKQWGDYLLQQEDS